MWIPQEKWRYVSAAAMRAADHRCIEAIGITGAVLMENAGAAVFDALQDGPPGAIGVVCGKGNNGGDGFVVARRALLAGRAVKTVVLAGPDDLRGDAKLFHDVLVRLGGEVNYIATEEDAAQAVKGLGDCAVLVDAILGTGYTGEVRGVPRALAAISAAPSSVMAASSTCAARRTMLTSSDCS